MPESRLAAILAHQLAWCLDHVTRRRTERLAKGLAVIVYVDLAGGRHVCLSRRGDTGPSQQEAKTVLQHWPEPVPPDVHWKAARLGQFSVLAAIWSPEKTAKQLVLGETKGRL